MPLRSALTLANSRGIRYEILEDTPPSGKRFADAVRKVMSSEQAWVSWKNHGCPDFFREGVELRKRKTDESITKV